MNCAMMHGSTNINTYYSISVGEFDVGLISNDTPELALMYNFTKTVTTCSLLNFL
jgi:hypothetical protein